VRDWREREGNSPPKKNERRRGIFRVGLCCKIRGRQCSLEKDDYRREKCSWIFATPEKDRKKKRHVVGGLFCKMTLSLSGEPLS